MARGAFTERTKRLLNDRCKGRCEKCGTPVVVKQFHHRRPRAMGGTRRPETGGMTNALVLHPNCHLWIEQHREQSYELGYLVVQHRNPGDTPVKLWDGWFLLAEDGSKLNVSANINSVSDWDAIKRGLEAVLPAVSADESENSPLADAKFHSGDVRGFA